MNHLRLLPRYLVLLVFCMSLWACGADPTPEASPTPATTGTSAKISSTLLNIYIVYKDRGKAAALAYARDNGLLDAKNEIEFELQLRTAQAAPAITAKVTAMGGRVLATQRTLMDVAVPADTFVTYATNTAARNSFLQDLADLSDIAGIHIIIRGQPQDMEDLVSTRAGLAQLAQSLNEGTHVIGADAWQTAGFRGKGVRIGIIDGGFRYVSDFRGTTLPADFTLKDFATGDSLIDSTAHGTAVAEVLHSIAPDATLIATSVSTETEFAQAAQYLLDQKVSIISTSMGFPAGPGNGDPDLSLVDATAATIAQAGVLLVTASGNNGVSHYAGVFNPDKDGFHQFAPGMTRVAFGYLHDQGPALNQIVVLNWQAWDTYRAHGAVPDLDLYIEDEAGNPIISSLDSQAAQPPREYVQMKLTMGKTYYARVRLKPGTPQPATPLILHLEATNGPPLQFSVARGSASVAPGDSPDALTVGAVPWHSNAIAYYSSQGPTTDGRLKPDISGPTEISSQAMAHDGETNFNGTSAATPQIAGAAALLKSANPALTATQLRDILLRHVRDLGPSGPDDAYGYGLVSLGTPGNATPVAAVVAPALDTALPPEPHLDADYPTPKGITPSPQATSAVAHPLSVPRVSDDFTADSGLPTDRNTGYSPGAYHIHVFGPDQLWWAVYRDTAADFTADVTVQPQMSIAGGVYGFIFWFTDPRNYYLASITDSPQPMVSISRFVAGKWQQIMGWTQAQGGQSITAGFTQLHVQGVEDGTIQISLNNGTMLTARNQAGASGAYGFAAGLLPGATGNYTVLFHSFRLSG